MSNRGFTIVELVVVIIILGLLAVALAPRFMTATEVAEQNNVLSAAGNYQSAITMVSLKFQSRSDVNQVEIDLDDDPVTTNDLICFAPPNPWPQAAPCPVPATLTAQNCYDVFVALLQRVQIPVDIFYQTNRCVFVYDKTNVRDADGLRLEVNGNANITDTPRFELDLDTGRVITILE